MKRISLPKNITILNKKVTMTTIATTFGMKEALAQLGVNERNLGTSTGKNQNRQG